MYSFTVSHNHGCSCGYTDECAQIAELSTPSYSQFGPAKVGDFFSVSTEVNVTLLFSDSPKMHQVYLKETTVIAAQCIFLTSICFDLTLICMSQQNQRHSSER